MSSSVHKESTFEAAIVEALLAAGWTSGKSNTFDKELALDKADVLSFVKGSQPKEWDMLSKYYQEDTENKFFQRLYRELDLRGMLDVIRHGIVDSGIRFQLAYFKPDSRLNQDSWKAYQNNLFSVTRQLYYSGKNQNSIDILLSLNGLPLATMELKNSFTGQTVEDAKRQYREDRDPRELLFAYKKRCVVHFAIDSDEIYLTTKLSGKDTEFLPFNRGYEKGAGNPPNPNGYKTSYFWEDLLRPDSWMEILSSFLHIKKEEVEISGRKMFKESTLFPRYHQIDVVRQLARDAEQNGPGKNYLIQHSAGSGKSNSIAWLAYRLGSLFDADDRRIFHSVVVITDRRVLDSQLQDTIYQFEHKQGVVQKIDDDSKQLASAIKSGTNIIITTLQKFPYALNHISEVPDRNYAVIIDEAHSSQGGEASRKMIELLAGKSVSLEQAEQIEGEVENSEPDEEDSIREIIRKRGLQKNLSIFAFTATPKRQTLEVFGTKDEKGKPIPFHLYSMKQAIEEHFILDVLRNYTSYKEYYKISKSITDDPELNKKKALRAIGRFASLHPYNLSQKTEVIVEHFRSMVIEKIGGRARAMVVTASRQHAYEYYLSFMKYLEEKGYSDIIPVVAFSGELAHNSLSEKVSEASLNQFKEQELPKKFAENNQFKFLIVADKYQTGFDQPLLHSMYIDKKLSGVKAVQTLSRLNRVYPGKRDTFVLDFANEREGILKSFQPYYMLTSMQEATDPNRLFDLKARLDKMSIYYQMEVDGFAKIFYKPGGSLAKAQSKLYSFVDPGVDRYSHRTEEEQDEFKKNLNSYIELYSFLSQIMPFQDIGLEKLYSFGRFLSIKLPKQNYSDRLQLDDDITLEYYRLRKVAEADLVLEIQGISYLDPIGEPSTKKDKQEKAKLSDIIQILNERYGMNLNEADSFNLHQIEEDCLQDVQLKLRARNNSIENYKFALQEIFMEKILERISRNNGVFEKILENPEITKYLIDQFTERTYVRFNEKVD
ncbi:type I restriction endonuclease subunit R [Leptospira selangorensis]|uniref:Type I restriction endonuclease subunit R n=1 Tax=Leptospira selangorensis TaxID=2484982 RepID=A0A5F2BXR6_9LEPT|nr:type I restriction endonuclease [Leptospira selangorensis]TGM12099.1 type I restriction endonuclease subunit R [Leptospira selangorensis]TGM14858.1 type I restriction endonuclease subunit R [Leptospira selangorensis]